MKKCTRRGEYAPEFITGELQKTVRDAAGHRCEQCGIAFRPGTNLAVSAVNADGKPVIGTVHHIDWNPANSALDNLVYLCAACHTAVHGFGWRPGSVIPLAWKGNIPQWVIDRELPWRDHPQLSLF